MSGGGALAVSDYAPARGADELWASADGRVLAAELRFAGILPPPSLIKVIERDSGDVIAHARGSVVAAPDELGEVLYVTSGADGKELTHPALRSTARADLAVALAPAGSADFARWSGFRLGASRDHVAVLREEPHAASIEIVSLPDSKQAASRAFPERELRIRAAAASPTRDILYLLAIPAGSAPGTGALIALDALTLRDRWRVPWPKGHDLTAHPALAVSGDGSTVVAYAPSGLFALDAATGERPRVLPFYGFDRVQLVGVPGRPMLVARRGLAARGQLPRYVIESIDVSSGAVAALTEEHGPANLPAIAMSGTVVLVAPAAAPRDYADPATWGPELSGFVEVQRP